MQIQTRFSETIAFSLATGPNADARFLEKPDAALAFSIVTGPNVEVRFKERPDPTLAFSLVTGPNPDVRFRERPDATLYWLMRNRLHGQSQEKTSDEMSI